MDDQPGAAAPHAPWKVLLVDDEPAVHEVSRLILAGLTFDGGELELISAGSAASARALLAQHADIALALVDVVMETDDAGIALVQHIRQQRHDSDMQIVLRTGQPGMAPERDVMRHYEINGYYLKTEITAQRLHSIVISGLRGYRLARSLRAAGAAPPPPAGAADSALAQALATTGRDAPALLWLAQPEVALAGHEVTGIELVPQWRLPHGLESAARVHAALPDGATRAGVVRTLLEQACARARSWDGRLTVSLPLVGDSLGDPAALAAIVGVVGAARLPPATLDLLVGETTLLHGRPEIAAAVATLRALGVSFTLTDFGAQTIPLPRLSELAPDRLKLHRLFVRGVAGDPERAVLARSLIALAHTLDSVAIADGISSDGELQFFRWEGCDLGQGDALAPACAPDDVAAALRDGPPPAH